ncbi:MAG TPA: hypothetical protein VF661_13590 [Actinomycetales bacterium]|jgi:hypothetical protein
MRLTLAAVLLAAPALALTGCSAAGGDPAASSPAATAPVPGTQEPAPGSTPSGSSSGSSSGASTPTSPAQVLVEADYTVPTEPTDKVKVAVTELTVSGEVMTLRLQVTPTLASKGPNEAVNLYDFTRGQRIFLLDRANLKRYDLVNGAGGAGSLQSDVVLNKTLNGTALSWWGVYAAPEDDIDSLELYVLDAWAPLVVPVA